MAKYRVGKYGDALKVLIRSDEINSEEYDGAYPGHVGFIAMAHHRLGHLDEAKAQLERLRQLVEDQSGADVYLVRQYHQHLREAEELIEGEASFESDDE